MIKMIRISHKPDPDYPPFKLNFWDPRFFCILNRVVNYIISTHTINIFFFLSTSTTRFSALALPDSLPVSFRLRDWASGAPSRLSCAGSSAVSSDPAGLHSRICEWTAACPRYCSWRACRPGWPSRVLHRRSRATNPRVCLWRDRKSKRLNCSHRRHSYDVYSSKKQK